VTRDKRLPRESDNFGHFRTAVNRNVGKNGQLGTITEIDTFCPLNPDSS
jgi:hypothetical protein